MTRLEKLIGFPVPQEHRKELNERLQMYENSDRTALISLLLQYDWELIQLTEQKQEENPVPQNNYFPIGEVIETAAKAVRSAEVIARIKQDHYPELFKKVLEMRNAQMDELVKWASHHESSFFGLRTIRTQRDYDKAKARRIVAECEVDDFIKEHKEDFK